MPPKKSSTAMVKWEARLAELAAQTTKTVADVGGGGSFISLKSGVLSYQKTPIPDNKMSVIVLASILENQWFAEAYQEGMPASPACYAFGDNRKTMAPHEAVEEPVNPVCLGCPNKEWGTAERGKGKACGDVMRLALITEADLEDVDTAEIAFMKLPYFSTLDWAGYVRSLDEGHHKPPLAFVTEIHVVPDQKSQFRVKFRMVEPIDTDDVGWTSLFKRQAEAASSIAFPYPKFEAAEQAPVPPARGRARTNGRVAVPVAAAPPTRTRAAAMAAPPRRAAAVALPASTLPVAAAGRRIAVGAARAVKQPKF